MAEPADIAVDDLRRRARRRLVGAIVLALGAAVIVPMLLESEPKPLGESVQVKIPPVDDGKFVNRLNDSAPKSDTATKDAHKDTPAADAANRKSIADAEKAVITPPAKAPKYDTQIAGDKAATPAPGSPADATPPPAAAPPVSSPPSTDAPTAPKAEAAPPKVEAPPKSETPARSDTPPKTEAKSVPPPKAEPRAVEAAPAATKNGIKDGFAVQLAAFSDDKGANSLANRLKRDGYPVYTEPLKTSRGTLWRVRVGPFPSRDAANAVRDKLKTEGQNGIVAPTH
jgi:DedD protein